MLVKAYGKGLSHDNVDDAPRNLVGVSPYTRGPSPDTCNPFQTFVHLLKTMLPRSQEKVAVWVQRSVVLTVRSLASRGAPSQAVSVATALRLGVDSHNPAFNILQPLHDIFCFPHM